MPDDGVARLLAQSRPLACFCCLVCATATLRRLEDLGVRVYPTPTPDVPWATAGATPVGFQTP